MAKASDVEWQKCMEFANGLEDQVRDLEDEKLGRWVKEHYVYLSRTLYGFRVVVDNCCDPKADTMEFKPEFVQSWSVLRRLTEKVERANGLQHSGGTIAPEDWSELYDLVNEAKAVLEKLPQPATTE